MGLYSCSLHVIRCCLNDRSRFENSVLVNDRNPFEFDSWGCTAAVCMSYAAVLMIVRGLKIEYLILVCYSGTFGSTLLTLHATDPRRKGVVPKSRTQCNPTQTRLGRRCAGLLSVELSRKTECLWEFPFWCGRVRQSPVFC